MDYESPLARRVAGDLWSGISRAALGTGYDKTIALWKSLGEPGGPGGLEDSLAHVFVIGQDRPEAVEDIGMKATGSSRLCGMVVAVPERPSPLSGALLYQGIGALTDAGVRAGNVLPALVPAAPKTEGEAYTARLLDRLRKLQAASPGS
ncbi:MAG: hypothetical protein WA990_06960 [Rubrobacteraceae bacterium]